MPAGVATSPSVDVEFRTGTSMGARCARCFLDGHLVHAHTTGQPIDYTSDRCAGCQEPICDRHGVREQWPKRTHSAMDHRAAESG
jgi:hypothetical protein